MKRGVKMKFSKKLLIARAKLNLSQTQLAEILGVSLITINRWENEQSKPSKVAMIKFEEFCIENKILFKENQDD